MFDHLSKPLGSHFQPNLSFLIPPLGPVLCFEGSGAKKFSPFVHVKKLYKKTKKKKKLKIGNDTEGFFR